MFSFLNTNENLNCAYPVIKETIPKSSLGYNTNNQYPFFPPKMSDGRAITASWQPEAIINHELLKETGIKTNWEYRKYLTKNANEIVKYNFTESCNDVGYYKRLYNQPEDTNNFSPPYLYNSLLDNKDVLGIKKTDLKQLYLSREQLSSRKVSPVITQEELLRLPKN
jgi:hypothetical protein